MTHPNPFTYVGPMPGSGVWRFKQWRDELFANSVEHGLFRWADDRWEKVEARGDLTMEAVAYSTFVDRQFP